MPHELTLVSTWLYSVLSGDSTLTSYAPGGVFRSLAPPLTSTPFIIFSFLSGLDVTTMNAFRLMDDIRMQVKAVGPSKNTQNIANAALQVDVLLGGPTSGTTTGGAVLACYRDAPLQVDELVDGELWTNIGGIYRIIIEKTS